MAIIRTDKSFVTFAPETVYGVAPQTGWSRFGYHDTAILPDPTYGWTPYYSLGYPRRNTLIKGRQSYKGTIPDIKLTNLAALFLPLSTGNDSDLFDLAPLPSFSLNAVMYDTDGNIALGRTWSGGRINRCTISQKEGEELRFSIDEMIFNSMVNTRNTNVKYANVAYPDLPLTTDRYLYTSASVVGFGVPIGRCKSFSIEINNNLVEWYGMTNINDQVDYSPRRILSGKKEYKLNIELDVVDAATDLQLWDFLINQGGSPAQGSSFSVSLTGDVNLILQCSSFWNSQHPGTIIESMSIPMDVTRGGYYKSTLTANVDYVRVRIS